MGGVRRGVARSCFVSEWPLDVGCTTSACLYKNTRIESNRIRTPLTSAHKHDLLDARFDFGVQQQQHCNICQRASRNQMDAPSWMVAYCFVHLVHCFFSSPGCEVGFTSCRSGEQFGAFIRATPSTTCKRQHSMRTHLAEEGYAVPEVVLIAVNLLDTMNQSTGAGTRSRRCTDHFLCNCVPSNPESPWMPGSCRASRIIGVAIPCTTCTP